MAANSPGRPLNLVENDAIWQIGHEARRIALCRRPHERVG
jgi:hypothetical protein